MEKGIQLDRLLDLQRLLLAFNSIERGLLLPTSPDALERNETNTEHSYSLAIAAWFLAQDLPQLDVDKCIRYALAHDLVELHSGDTFAYDKDIRQHESKAEREHLALEKLRHDWPDFSGMTEAIANYETRADAESKFVYALDKIMPMLINYLSGGKGYRLHGVKLADVKSVKATKVAASPEVNALYKKLIAVFEAKPELFEKPQLAESDQDLFYLKRAIHLSEQSAEPTGCGVVIVREEIVLAETCNSQRGDNIAVHHAEIKAIIEANRKTGSRKLEHATAYCSCEPCAMCLTALSYTKVERIVFHHRMRDLFPDDPQSQLDPYAFSAHLNFVPKLIQLSW